MYDKPCDDLKKKKKTGGKCLWEMERPFQMHEKL